MPWDPPGGAGGSVRGEGSLGVPAQAAAPATWPRISGIKWMAGWTFKHSSAWTQTKPDITTSLYINILMMTPTLHELQRLTIST